MTLLVLEFLGPYIAVGLVVILMVAIAKAS